MLLSESYGVSAVCFEQAELGCTLQPLCCQAMHTRYDCCKRRPFVPTSMEELLMMPFAGTHLLV